MFDLLNKIRTAHQDLGSIDNLIHIIDFIAAPFLYYMHGHEDLSN